MITLDAVSTDTVIALVALIVSVVALALSFYFWRRQFRPIVTAAVKTHDGGNVSITYDLVLLNCGTIPAKNIQLKANEASLALAFGKDATSENKKRWLACFDSTRPVAILHNNDRVSCSFGTSSGKDGGFWKYRSKIAIEIEYKGWFGTTYKQSQEIELLDSDSFTGFM